MENETQPHALVKVTIAIPVPEELIEYFRLQWGWIATEHRLPDKRDELERYLREYVASHSIAGCTITFLEYKIDMNRYHNDRVPAHVQGRVYAPGEADEEV